MSYKTHNAYLNSTKSFEFQKNRERILVSNSTTPTNIFGNFQEKTSNVVLICF